MVSKEYRDLLTQMMKETVAAAIEQWQDEYNNADSFKKGEMVGDLIYQVAATINAVAGTAKSVNALSKAIKSGEFRKIVKNIISATAKLKNAIKSNESDLSSLITKVYSRYNGFIEVEFAGFGRITLKEADIIEDADQICKDRYAKWIESKMNEADDAAKAKNIEKAEEDISESNINDVNTEEASPESTKGVSNPNLQEISDGLKNATITSE